MSNYTKHLTIDFSDAFAPNRLYYDIERSIRGQGWQDFELVGATTTAYPNTCVPVAGIIEHYRDLGVNISCDWTEVQGSYVSHTRAHAPYVVNSDEGERRLRRPFDVVWRFSDPLDIKALVDAARTEVCEHSDVEEGVLTSIEWCLYEVMDNVLQHSDAGCGYFMGQHG